jgi:hypothetical protein
MMQGSNRDPRQFRELLRPIHLPIKA